VNNKTIIIKKKKTLKKKEWLKQYAHLPRKLEGLSVTKPQGYQKPNQTKTKQRKQTNLTNGTASN
jgi:hypothetical protein